ERALPRAHLLEQWRFAGMAECPASATFAFEDGDLVAIGDQRRIGKSGWPGTDDGDAFARRALAGGKTQLLPGGAVDDTAELRAAAHLVDAGVAGETASHRLVAADLLDPVGISNQRAPERDEIRLAGRERRLRCRRIAEASDGDHRHLH